MIGGLSLVLALAVQTTTSVTPLQPLNPAQWITDDDYPPDALRQNEQGSVGFLLEVGADGSPRACRVTSSSGSPTLDVSSCSLMMQRAKFKPAIDASGKPMAAKYASRFIWRIPVSDGPPGSKMEVTISRAPDNGYRCAVTSAKPVPAFSQAQCTALAEAVAKHRGDAVGTITLSPPIQSE